MKTAVIQGWKFLLEFHRATVERNIGLIAAGVAFFALLALFPGIAAFISLFGLFADPVAIQGQLALIEDIMPDAAYTLLQNQITRLVWSNDGTLGWAGALSTVTALVLARRGVDAMLRGVQAVYGSKPRSGLFHSLNVAIITLGMVVVGVVALLSMLVLPILLAFFPLAGFSGVAVELGRWAVALGMVTLWLWVFYRLGPVRDRGSVCSIRPGLALAVFLWVAVSFGFTVFLANFGRYNEVYGSLGAVVALLMWFYLSAYVVMLGGVLNALLEKRRQTDALAMPAQTVAAPVTGDAPLTAMSDETDPPAKG